MSTIYMSNVNVIANRTIIHFTYFRLPDTKAHLIDEVTRLRTLLLTNGDLDVHAALASTHEILGDIEIALMHTDILMRSSLPRTYTKQF